MIGGKDGKANFTMLQWRALESHVIKLIRQYPDAKVAGHSNFSNKQCPSFDVESWWHN
ncbi:MAG TPA: hypothetical protein EYO51_00945 [Methylococcaceae bacterium]|jgi:N-acetyl-anhydromuramyl-L-alanine amidase AmpD|nr:hypothetical protein [Methylococcaceae bacterium]HIN68941.1 hypothetical protein [Methylococcales bacterium]HIA45063.1 hypothetical protein [Methylococcaceae bacterium]HIB61725.1 hypothetical protein [Methylococcaceae bacterium]HIO12905.1 hypothetical protein [Methylococcales bacterium]